MTITLRLTGDLRKRLEQRAAGEIQGEFLAIHPFREGNARAIKLLVDLLAAQTGRPLLTYDASEEGKERAVNAAKAALLLSSPMRRSRKRRSDSLSTGVKRAPV